MPIFMPIPLIGPRREIKIQEEARKSAIIDGEKIGGNSDSFSLTALVQKEKKRKRMCMGQNKMVLLSTLYFLKEDFFPPPKGKKAGRAGSRQC